MQTYLVRFSVTGVSGTVELQVRSSGDSAAREVIRAMYPGRNITFYGVQRV